MALDSVVILFPRIKQTVSRFGIDSNSNIRKNNRIAHAEKFDLYFSLNLEDIKISRAEVEDFINSKNELDLLSFIKIIIEEGNIKYLIDEVESMNNDIPYNRLNLILIVFLKSIWRFPDESDGGIFFNSPQSLANKLVFKLLKKLKTDTERYDIIKTSLLKINNNGLASIGMILNKIDISYGKDDLELRYENNQIINLEQLKEIEELYIKRLNDIKNLNSVLELRDFEFILYFWEKIDNHGISSYLEKILSDDINKLKFICALARSWSGSYGEGWSFSEDVYSKYISTDEIYDLIKSLDNEILIKFSIEEQIKLATFILVIENNREHITEKEAKEYLNNWNNNI